MRKPSQSSGCHGFHGEARREAQCESCGEMLPAREIMDCGGRGICYECAAGERVPGVYFVRPRFRRAGPFIWGIR